MSGIQHDRATHVQASNGESAGPSANHRAVASIRPQLPYARVRILVVDDDPWSLRLLRGMLRECFPMVHVDTRTSPDVSGDYHMVFIDNDFSGKAMAAPLARQVRSASPHALIIAFSATLDRPALIDLLNAGCDGVCDKSRLEDLPKVMEIAQRYIEALIAAPNVEKRLGLLDAVRSVRGLLNEWNRRLAHAEAANRGGDSR